MFLLQALLMRVLSPYLNFLFQVSRIPMECMFSTGEAIDCWQCAFTGPCGDDFSATESVELGIAKVTGCDYCAKVKATYGSGR